MEETKLNKQAQAQGKLGKAVHPGAVKRLIELCPNALVFVEHETAYVPLPDGELKMDGPRTRPQRETRVRIETEGAPNGIVKIDNRVVGRAVCHPEDNYNRREGIRRAFHRALVQISEDRIPNYGEPS